MSLAPKGAGDARVAAEALEKALAAEPENHPAARLMLGVAPLVFPKLALGVSGVETGVPYSPDGC